MHFSAFLTLLIFDSSEENISLLMIIQLHEAFDSEGLRIKTLFLGDHIFKTHHQLLELQAKTKWREEELEYKISY